MISGSAEGRTGNWAYLILYFFQIVIRELILINCSYVGFYTFNPNCQGGRHQIS